MTAAYLDTHELIVGTSGAGKTVTAKDQVEQLLEHGRHTCIVDPTGVWHGLRSGADGESEGFPIPIFGGQHGDVPITYDQGGKIGAIIATGVSAIIDLSQMDSDEQQEFVAAMISVLRKKPRGNFHLVVDEADEFAPQTSPSKAGEAAKRQMEWIAKRGRVQGFVLTAITQRVADIAKSVISQMQTVIAHQLIEPSSLDAIKSYLRANADKETLAKVMGSLPSLERGERWIYSPRLGILERGVSPVPRTFDSSRTPEPGESVEEPKMLAQIDLGAIAAQLAPPAEEVRPNSAEMSADSAPTSLRDWDTVDLIDELERRDPEWLKGHDEFQAAIADRDHWQGKAERSNECIINAARALGYRDIEEIGREIDDKREREAMKPARIPSPAPVQPKSQPVLQVPTGTGQGDATIPPRWQRILDAAAWSQRLLKRDAVERGIVAWLAETSPKSSGFQNDLGAMRTRGLLDYPVQGSVALTDAGRFAANWPSKTPTREALFEAIKRRLEPRHCRILDAVYAAGSPLNRAELADEIGASASSSGFQNDLGKLRTLGLIDYPQQGCVGLGRVLG